MGGEQVFFFMNTETFNPSAGKRNDCRNVAIYCFKKQGRGGVILRRLSHPHTNICPSSTWAAFPHQVDKYCRQAGGANTSSRSVSLAGDKWLLSHAWTGLGAAGEEDKDGFCLCGAD